MGDNQKGDDYSCIPPHAAKNHASDACGAGTYKAPENGVAFAFAAGNTTNLPPAGACYTKKDVGLLAGQKSNQTKHNGGAKMEKIVVIGNLVKDPELIEARNGTKICRLTVVVNYKESSGEKKARYYTISVFSKMGESCYTYLQKGKKVAVIGTPTFGAYLGKDGTPRMNLSILASEIEFLSPKQKNEESNVPETSGPDKDFVEVDEDEDLPF